MIPYIINFLKSLVYKKKKISRRIEVEEDFHMWI